MLIFFSMLSWKNIFLSGYVKFFCVMFLSSFIKGYYLFQSARVFQESFVPNFDLIISPTKIFDMHSLKVLRLSHQIKRETPAVKSKHEHFIKWRPTVRFFNNIDVCLFLWITRAYCGQKFNMHSIRHFGSYDSFSYHYKYLKEWCNSNKMIRFCTFSMLKM